MNKHVPSRQLTIKPAVIPGETPVGFLHRAFSINGRRWDVRLLGQEGVEIVKLIHGQRHSAWETYFGQNPGSLVEVKLPKNYNSMIKLKGQTVRRDDWSSRYRRWCPECWKQDLNAPARGRSVDWNLYHRFWWDVVAISHCPHHHVKLESSCPDCDRPLQWHRGSMTRCDNGHTLLDKEGVAVAPEDCVFDEYLVARFEQPRKRKIPYLDSLDMASAVEVVERLGVASLGEDLGVSELRRSLGRSAIFTAGMNVVNGMPGSIGPLLDRVMEGAPNRKGKWGVLRAYGGLHNWVKGLPSSNLSTALRDEMMKHAQQHVTFKTGGGVGGVDAQLDRITFKDVAERCGISVGRLRRIAVVLGLKAEEKEQGKPTGFSLQSMQQLAKKLDGSMHLDECATKLGIATNALKGLVRAGIVKPIVPRTGPTGPGTWIFPRDTLAQLVAQLEERLVPTGPSRERWASLAPAAQTRRTSLAAVMELVLEGKVPVRLEDGVGISAFHVPISTLTEQIRLKRWPGETTQEFAKATGIPTSALTDYMQHGIIQAESHGVYWVCPEGEIARFMAKYVTVGEIQQITGTKLPRAAIAALSTLGVEPVCKRPPFLKVLYLRDDAVPAATAWRARQEEKRRSKPIRKPGLTAAQLAEKLQWDRALVQHLVIEGVIASHPGLVRYPMIPESEFDRLKRDFVIGTELASLLGKTASAAAIPILKSAGIAPTYSMPDGRYAVYPRQASEDAIAKHLVELEAARKVDDGIERLTLQASAVYLGITDLMMIQLARAEILNTKRDGRAVLVTKHELDDFRAEYILGNELDRLAGKAGGAASKLLKRSGVKPALDRPAFYSVVFRRSEALAALKRAT